jgi:hypothetical protein
LHKKFCSNVGWEEYSTALFANTLQNTQDLLEKSGVKNWEAQGNNSKMPRAGCDGLSACLAPAVGNSHLSNVDVGELYVVMWSIINQLNLEGGRANCPEPPLKLV